MKGNVNGFTYTLHKFVPKQRSWPNCDRCGKKMDLEEGKMVRRGIGRNKSKVVTSYYYCTDCIGLTLSRYSYSYIIPSPTHEELALKEKYDGIIDWEVSTGYVELSTAQRENVD